MACLNAYCRRSIHNTKGGRPTKHKGVISRDARGLVPGMQGDGFASASCGIIEVAMMALRTITTRALM